MDTPPPSQGALALRLFGEPRLMDGPADVTPRARKARGLIAYLAVAADHAASRDRLAELLWSDRGEEQARASLRQTLTEMRAGILGHRAAFSVDREIVRLSPGAFHTDLAAATAACHARDPAAIACALEAVGGAFLDGLDGLSPGFDDWLVGERARQQDRLIALAADAAEAIDPHAHDLRPVLAAIARIDPGNERAARLGFRLDHAAGDTAGLHRRYKALADHLQRDLGVRPAEETRALFESLKTAAAAPARVQEDRAHFQAAPPPVPDAPPLLVVAHFTDLATDAPVHLATAIRHEILSGLSRFRDLRLASSDVEGGPGTYTLGAILRSGARGLVIQPQLVRGGDGGIVWAERFDLPADDLQPAIDRIIGRIVAAVLPALIGDMVATLGPTQPAGIYGRFLLARHASLRPRDYAAARAAAKELESIVAEAPEFGAPKLALARIYNTDYVWTRAASSGVAERARALDLARAALALDHEDVNAWTVVGWSHLWHGNWLAAEQHLDSALTINPFNVARLLEIAFGRVFLGNLDGATAVLDRCMDIEPRPGDALNADRGFMQLISGDFESANTSFEMVSAHYLESAIHASASAALAGRPVADLRERTTAIIRSMHDDSQMPSMLPLFKWLRTCQPFRYNAHWEILRGGIEKALS